MIYDVINYGLLSQLDKRKTTGGGSTRLSCVVETNLS